MTTAPVELRYSSRLRTPAADVWAAAMSLAGINAEAMPIFRMTAPPGIHGMVDAEFVPGQMLFRSRVLAFGLIPYDWTELTLVEFEPGRRFVERSRMGSMHGWQHIRTVDPVNGGCVVTDELCFEPKWPRPIARLMIDIAFRNRHRQLKRRFGAMQEADNV
ncbi:MAG: hypothetical protein JNN10_10345 [Sphingopyxis sp.]|uniref:hypothetical protein n=1 Tax=Sphingopyxis sp. TaxID=1908224 RepID=UPI001A4E4C61|nr:hypothetical protein [Sphingopyxis sp.]MBL9066678.1 hypothetical protein [Sphingopyxis sp.]